MQIVTDSGMDLPQEKIEEYDIHIVPHRISIGGKTYLSNVDLFPPDLYRLLEETGEMPITSVPSAGDFAEMYRKLAKDDPEILSIHMSSGLSAPVNAATAAKQMVPEIDVTIVDTKTLSAVLGWMVSAAARAIRAGWNKERIIKMIHQLGDVSESNYTLDELKYLVHGGRISHMEGLLASALNLRPIIEVEKVGGTYAQVSITRTFKRALQGLVNQVKKHHAPGTALLMQLGHAHNPDAVQQLFDMLDPLYDCRWMPTCPMTAMMGAHTGPTMTGVAYAALADLPEMPPE
ncbi:MAG: DegV family protein [Anaerolineae bacterium]|nr:DegV family protein [Anaerolineae bacterium]